MIRPIVWSSAASLIRGSPWWQSDSKAWASYQLCVYYACQLACSDWISFPFYGPKGSLTPTPHFLHTNTSLATPRCGILASISCRLSARTVDKTVEFLELFLCAFVPSYFALQSTYCCEDLTMFYLTFRLGTSSFKSVSQSVLVSIQLLARSSKTNVICQRWLHTGVKCLQSNAASETLPAL